MQMLSPEALGELARAAVTFSEEQGGSSRQKRRQAVVWMARELDKAIAAPHPMLEAIDGPAFLALAEVLALFIEWALKDSPPKKKRRRKKKD